MKKATDGQVFSEYIVTIAIVLGAMALIGPSLITSVNSYFQALDSGAREAHEETQEQSAPTGITLAGCTCGPLEKVGCGDDITCSKQKVVMKANCVPLGCERDMPLSAYYDCVDDPAAECCTDPTISNICGDGGCPADELLSSQTCGMNNVIKTECVDDNGNCVVQCVGTPYAGPPPATLCVDSNGEGDNFNIGATDVQITHVLDGGCTDPLKCEYECPPDRIVMNNTCACKVTYVHEKLKYGTTNTRWHSWNVDDTKFAIGGANDQLNGIDFNEDEKKKKQKKDWNSVNKGLPAPPGGFKKENIEAIRMRVRIWGCQVTDYQVPDITVVNDDNNDHYQFYWLIKGGTGKKFRCKSHTEYNAGICPGGLKSIMSYEGVPNDNHSMNTMAVAYYDTNDYLDYINIRKCSPDTSGKVDSVDLCYKLFIHYDFCQTWDPANFTCPTDKSKSCKTANGYTCTPP